MVAVFYETLQFIIQLLMNLFLQTEIGLHFSTPFWTVDLPAGMSYSSILKSVLALDHLQQHNSNGSYFYGHPCKSVVGSLSLSHHALQYLNKEFRKTILLSLAKCVPKSSNPNISFHSATIHSFENTSWVQPSTANDNSALSGIVALGSSDLGRIFMYYSDPRSSVAMDAGIPWIQHGTARVWQLSPTTVMIYPSYLQYQLLTQKPSKSYFLHFTFSIVSESRLVNETFTQCVDDMYTIDPKSPLSFRWPSPVFRLILKASSISVLNDNLRQYILSIKSKEPSSRKSNKVVSVNMHRIIVLVHR
jgi:hypothetical protein